MTECFYERLSTLDSRIATTDRTRDDGRSSWGRFNSTTSRRHSVFGVD
jgi:hypothetical protein